MQLLPSILSSVAGQKGEKVTIVLIDEEDEEETNEIKEVIETKATFLLVNLEFQFAPLIFKNDLPADTYRLKNYTVVTSPLLLPPEIS